MSEVEISLWKELVLLRQLKTSHNCHYVCPISRLQSKWSFRADKLNLFARRVKTFPPNRNVWDWNVVISCYWLLAKLLYTFHNHYIILSWLLQLVMCGFIGSWQNYLIVIMIIISYYYDNYLCLHVGAWKVVIAYYWLLATPNLEDNTCSSKENM